MHKQDYELVTSLFSKRLALKPWTYMDSLSDSKYILTHDTTGRLLMRDSILLAITTLLIIGCNGSTTEQGDNATEIRTLAICDVNGTELITQDDILAYDTETHILTLAPGKRDKIVPSQSLIGGSPFTIFVDGKSQYSGRFTTSLSSQSIDDVVIDLLAPELEVDQLQLSLGYPTSREYTAAGDPRGNENVITAVRAMGKAGG